MVAMTFFNLKRRWLWVPAFARSTKSARRHPYCAVEADGFAVDHRIFDNVHRERAVFRGIAEPRRMRHLRAEAFARLFIQAHQERRQKQAWRDGVDANKMRGEVG